MTVEMKLSADRRLEWAAGKVAEDKMAWMYGPYFAAMGPVMAEHGNETAAGFVVVDASGTGVKPASGVFSSWPSAEAHAGFHTDPRFLEVVEERDASFEMFTGGHFVDAHDEVLVLNTDHDYALVIAATQSLPQPPIIDLKVSDDNKRTNHQGKSLALYPWTDAAEELRVAPGDGAEVYRIRFNPAAR
ncbi:hypothetical protein [Thalassobius sp. MITS945101]|uniref:hypothetical protein n=1 Tax=Thalassobius sp. MITS945101 TaxID=3096994 RepID=UPI00399BE3D8